MLCIKIASRGDLLLAGPAFRLLRESRRDSLITLLVGESCKDVAQHLPYFDQILILNDRALMAGSFLEKIGGSREFLRLIKRSRFDQVFIFHRDWRYSILAKMAGIRGRFGFQHKGHRWLLKHVYDAPETEHHVMQYLAVAALPGSIPSGYDCSMAGIWQFAVGERELALDKAKKHGFDPSTGRWVALGFGGGRNVKTRTRLKTWPLGHYKTLATELLKRDFRVAWIGDEHDARDLGSVEVGTVLAGKLSVPETAAVLSVCTKTVANDTLLLHLSESVDVPSLGLFGPTDPSHYRPLGVRSSYLWKGIHMKCSPCHRSGIFPICEFEHACLQELSPMIVLSQLLEGL